MTMKPCLTCGTPATGPRCDDHTVDPKASATDRGYDGAWKRLAKRAKRLQNFCEFCGSVEDLQCDHTPQAWERKAAGKAVRLQDVRVLCGACNRAAGAARGPSATRGGVPHPDRVHPHVRQSFRYTPEAS